MPARAFRTVMVVDDDAALRRSAARVLGTSRRVLTASTPTEALDLAAREPIELAVIDLVLRGASGIDLLVELKQQHPELAAVMMSGLFYTGSMRRAYRAGALDCFEKPFRWTNLLDSLEHGAAIESGRDGRVEVPTFEQLKIDYYRRVIEACDGNLTQAAKFAGLHRTTLQRIVHKRPGTRGG